MKQRGRPIRGGVAGLFFGLFVSLDLVIFGVVALDADILAILPVLGIVAGVLLGMTAPLQRRSAGGNEDRGAPVPPVATPEPEPQSEPEPTSTTA